MIQVQKNINATDYLFFEVDVTSLYKDSKNGVIDLEFKEYYKLRRVPFPSSIGITQMQMVKYEESRYFLSPYLVQTQKTIFKIEEHRINSFTLTPGAEKINNGIKYGPYKDMQPYSFEIIMMHFDYADPLLILTEAERVINLSHWGNIHVDDHFFLRNAGAKVAGEWSRVDFDKSKYGQNCLTAISAEMPWYIQGLYVNDFIGNISSTHAFREESHVKFDFEPRFGICGGWKTDWH